MAFQPCRIKNSHNEVVILYYSDALLLAIATPQPYHILILLSAQFRKKLSPSLYLHLFLKVFLRAALGKPIKMSLLLLR